MPPSIFRHRDSGRRRQVLLRRLRVQTGARGCNPAFLPATQAAELRCAALREGEGEGALPAAPSCAAATDARVLCCAGAASRRPTSACVWRRCPQSSACTSSASSTWSSWGSESLASVPQSDALFGAAAALSVFAQIRSGLPLLILHRTSHERPRSAAPSEQPTGPYSIAAGAPLSSDLGPAECHRRDAALPHAAAAAAAAAG